MPNLKSSFLKNILTLFTGSIMSQVILLGISPILTRLYKPSDFGEYAFYLSIVTILSVAATGRYDLAIMIAEDDEKADATTLLSLTISAIFGTILFILAFLSKNILFLNRYQNVLLLSSFHIALIGFYNTFYHRLNRYGKFKTISVLMIIQSTVVALYQLSLGVIDPSSIHLIIGTILGVFVAVMIILFIEKIDTIIKSKHLFIKMAKRFINFPKFDLWAGLFNIGFQQLPVIIITSFFGTINAGYFSLTQRVLQTPVSLIGGSILGAFRQKAVEHFREFGECKTLFLKLMKFMFFIGLPPTIIILIFGKELFVLVFGKDWRDAGLFSQILVLTFLIRFVTSPLSYLFYIAERQSWNLIGQFMFIIVTIISFGIGYYFNSIIIGLSIYSAGNFVLYALYLYISYLFSKGLYVNKS